MPRVIWSPAAGTDDAGQNRNTQNFGSTGGTWANEMRLQASYTSATGTGDTINDIGIRFIGTIPAGTKAIPTAKLDLSAWYSTHTAAAGVVANIHLEKRQSTVTFPVTGQYVYPDLEGRMSSRTTASADITWDGTSVVKYDAELAPLFKELLKDIGGAVYANPNDPTDLIATSPTTVDIINPVVLIRASLLTGSQIMDMRITAYDSYLNATTNMALAKYKIPKLDMVITPQDQPQTPSDRRTHILVLTDSIGWALQPGQTYSNSLMSFVFAGKIDTDGFYRLDNPPGGQVSVVSGGQAYSIDDPYGDGGLGSIKLEGRQGFTTYGVLKDRLIHAFGVSPTDIVIHPMGLGGTTASAVGRSQGIWSSATDKNATYASLSTVNVNGNLSEITNPLWLYPGGEEGQNALQVLKNTSIERLIVLYIGGGNDFFGVTYEGAGGFLPISRSMSVWNNAQTQVQTAYQDIGRFCKNLRAAAGGSPPEFMIMGYPNFCTDDSRLPKIKVNPGLPPDPSFHRGSWPSASSPDAWYGGPNSASDPNSYMAPLGSVEGAMRGSDTINMIPHIPWFLHYRSGNASYAQTNVPGVNITGLPRPSNKYDLGIFWQFKALSYCTGTFNYEYKSNDFRSWYGHWAADHYGGNGFSGATNADKWNTAFQVFSSVPPLYSNSYPYSVVWSNSNALFADLRNIKITIPYCARDITNETINGGMQTVIGGAAASAIATLKSEGLTCQFVPLWDSLGAEVGTGATASADIWAFLDGVHLTQAGAEKYNDAFISRARVASPILQTLTNWSSETTSRFMPFMNPT